MDLRTWTFVNILAPSPFLGAAADKQQGNVACFVSDGQAKLKDERPRWDEDDHLLRDVVIGFQENEPDPTQQSADVKFESSKEITQQIVQIVHIRGKEHTLVFKRMYGMRRRRSPRLRRRICT